jgi:predicted alpha/beta superfamily hydrolase
MRKAISSTLFLIIFINVCLGQLNTEPLIIGEKFELYSKYNNTSYTISVCLPNGYSNDTVDYPCIYLFYGRDAKFLAASGIITSMSDATWQIPRMIIVGVTNIQWQRDLTPVPIEGRENSGGAKEFLSFVTRDLFPSIDSNYRTTDYRLFMGHSFGGLFGIYSFIEDPEYFDDFILISPSIAQRADYIEEAFEQRIMNSNNLSNKFYFSSGSEGARISKSILWLQEGLESQNHENVKWKFELFEGHNHHTHTQASIMNGLLFIYDRNKDQ